MNAKDLKLDYFQIYDLEIPQDVRRSIPTIRLQGQFDKEEAEFARLQFLKKIATPVRKNNEEFFNKNGHLAWYNMSSSDPASTLEVKLENQFGMQKIVIYRVVGLLVPAQKRIMSPGNVFSRSSKLDHYKIYRVVDGTLVKSPPLQLEDQFHKRQAELGPAMAFAVPVRKEHTGKDFPILNEEAHLIIYRVSYSRDMPHMVEIRDQFGSHRYLKVGRSYLLAVPSKKIGWKVLD